MAKAGLSQAEYSQAVLHFIRYAGSSVADNRGTNGFHRLVGHASAQRGPTRRASPTRRRWGSTQGLYRRPLPVAPARHGLV